MVHLRVPESKEYDLQVKLNGEDVKQCLANFISMDDFVGRKEDTLGKIAERAFKTLQEKIDYERTS